VKKFDTEVRLSREMSLTDATLIGVGAMIGAGIFVLTGIAAGVAGPALIIAFGLNGVVALLTAMSYAELGSCYHDAGGGYLWVKEGLPRWNGFLSGWMGWFAHAVACSVYALGFGAYFGHVLSEFGVVLPSWGFLSPHKILAAGIAVLFGYINFRGASETGKIGNIVTITKIIILGIFIAFGVELIIRKGDLGASLTPFMPNGWGGIFKAMGLTFIAFEGYEVIAQSSEEIKNPRKNIPKAVFLSLILVIPIYLLVAVTALGSVNSGPMTPWDYLAQYKEIALVEVARKLIPFGGIMILVAGLVSTMSALNATIFSSSRVAFAMGRDRNFPGFFSKVHSKKFTPYWAIIISLFVIVLMAVSLPIEDVASAADIMFLLLFLQVNIAMIRLRKKRPDLDRGFKAPLYPWLSIAGIVMLLFLAVYMFNYSPIAWIVTGIWVIAGVGIYEGYASRRDLEHARKIKALDRIERKEYRVLCCLSNPKSLNNLSQVAFAIAKRHSAEVLFLNVIEVHEGQKLMNGLSHAEIARPLLQEAQGKAEECGFKTRSLVKLSHRISQGIVDTAIEEDCNFVIMGRQKHPSFLDRVFSSLIDTILYKSPCEVAILHGDLMAKEIRTILVPFAANIHTRLAIEVAPALLQYFNASLRVIVVMDPGLTSTERKERISKVNQLLGDNSLSGEAEPVVDTDILRGILQQSRQADLLLMGARSGDFLELLLAQSLTQEITERVRCPVLWVKEYEEKRPFWLSLMRSYRKEGE
jgi:amino acid transporter/nucleotide-binding universal stress UspA family protein